MAAAPKSDPSATRPRRRIRDLLPARIGRAARVWAWANLVAQTVIVGTGGLVRLTGSGLGCPTWPRCTEDSFVSTPEMGVHGIIEFGNRLLTFALVIIVIGLFLSVVRLVRTRPDLVTLAFGIGIGIPLQALIGGITVWTGLNPYVVGLHFVLSVALVVLSAAMIWRLRLPARGTVLAVPRPYAALSAAAGVAMSVTILIGILTTGSGPHAGDSGAARNDLDSELLQHLHSIPAYAAAALVGAMLVAAIVLRLPGQVRWVIAVAAVLVAQIVLGVVQARTGLPPFLVGAHMVLACVNAAVFTGAVLAQRASVTAVLCEERQDAVDTESDAPAR